MSNELTQAQIKFLNDYTKGTWTYNASTSLVDVDGDFDCCGSNLKDDLRNAGGETTLKNFMGVRFGKVSGDFDCSENYLTSLEGAPQEVGEYFNCTTSFLTSLEGAPQKVGGHFFCGYNELTNLKGAPQEVGGGFACEGDLSSLDGVPQEIGGWFSCEEFYLDEGQWNLEGWLSAWEKGPKAQKLILTLLSPEVLNKEIQKDPAGMIMKLKGVWNNEGFKEARANLVWPKEYEEAVKLVGDLDDIGI